MSEPENSKLNNNNLIISESNYSCEYFDEEFITQKNEKAKKLYNLEEKEREIYENQENLSNKFYKILSQQKRQFNSKYNKLKKERDFKKYYYDEYNNKIQTLLNNYNNNYNNSIVNILPSEFDKNWIFPSMYNNLSNNSFKKKCGIKSFDKKIINLKTNKENKYKSKSCNKLMKTYRTSINNSITNLKKQFSYNLNPKYKTERNSKFNSESKISRIRPKNVSARTSLKNSEKKYNLNSIIKNGKINWNDRIFNKKNNARYLTKENFYPKSYYREINKEKELVNNNNEYNSNKTSFGNYRRNKDLNDTKSFQKFESKFNLYNYKTNFNKKVVLGEKIKLF